jgi:Predicted AAA-ATPase/PD-(D/E)XK nuclease superfamily
MSKKPIPTASRRILPIGIASFAKIREQNAYYVDKTAFAWQLTRGAGCYFLSRPRRFGKSLFLDTLKELFEGNRTLFAGLFIEDKWDWSRNYPVVSITFGDGVLESRAALEEKILDTLQDNRERLGVSGSRKSISSQFTELLRLTRQKYGQRVVVLVDEYDKPLLDNLAESGTLLTMREALKNFYSVLKSSDADIHFVMMSGVSKFSKVNLFSGLNNLNDISLDPRYSALCGYTEADIDTVFAPELEGLDRAKMRRWYNGYNWLGDAVYNPFDLLLLFDKRKFHSWWYETGAPGFLVKLLAQRGFFSPDLANLSVGAELLSTFDVDQIIPEALLFQSGYLTIHSAKETLAGNWVYTLGYPNLEVEMSLNGSLVGSYLAAPSKTDTHRLRLDALLSNQDLAGLETQLYAFFASIPHQWYTNNPITDYEGFYASIIYSHFAALGYEIRVEDATNHGRIDMVMSLPGHVYVFEFKVVENDADGSAMRQIRAKNYADKYRSQGNTIHLIGIEFSRRTRNIVGFELALG